MSGKKPMNDDQSASPSATADTLAQAPGRGDNLSALGSDIQSKIGQHLRAMYDDVVRQGVPDRFMDLLAQLDKADDTPEGGGGGRR